MENIKMKDFYKEEPKNQTLKNVETRNQDKTKKDKKSKFALALFIIVIIIFVLKLPGFFNYFYQMGSGHAFMVIVESENLPWDDMTETERIPYIKQSKTEGLKSAILMTLGQHIPLYLFILITIGFLTNLLPDKIKKNLRYIFFGVWFFGMFFLSLGSQYWGQAPKFPASLGPAFIIYLVAGGFFCLIIKISNFIKIKIASNK